MRATSSRSCRGSRVGIGWRGCRGNFDGFDAGQRFKLRLKKPLAMTGKMMTAGGGKG
jgi:hypothetical protein